MNCKLKRIKVLFILLSVCTISSILSAQSLGYNNNRIAVSADGNNQADYQHKWPKADPDDWGGTPVALAIIAKLNLQDKLVHYSYNNFIAAPAHTTETNHMKIGSDGGIEYWNFDSERFFDVSADNESAINHLAIEMGKSTIVDPLYFIHMGPAEFLYRVVTKVIDDGNIDALSNLYIISHSGYNNNHLRRGDPKFDKKPVPLNEKHHTLDEALALSGNRINYKKIKDQNAGSQPNVLWKSHEDWTVWYWMCDHKDPSVRWIYERMLVNAKNSADVSDAGMLFYLLEGDEDGSPSKLKDFIGEGVLQTNSTMPSKNNTIRLVGIRDFEMKQIGSYVIPYKDRGRNAVAVNAGKHKYKFAATLKVFEGASGSYNITFVSLTEEDGESTYRIKVNGNLVAEFQNPETEKDMSPYSKVFSNVKVLSGDVIQIESNSHSNGKIPEGNAFAFARGRWRSISFEPVSNVK